MATVRSEQRMDGGKRAAVAALFAGSALIILAGVAFGVYSWIYRVSYPILGNDIPGYIFAAIVVFLGVRYFRSVFKMKKTLSESKAGFNWDNFKPDKAAKETKAGKARKRYRRVEK